MIIPKYVKSGEYYEFYLGLAYISSYLKSSGFNVFCLNPNHSDKPLEKQISDCIQRYNIDVVCTGGMSFHYNEISKVLDIVKELNPKIKTIVGGAIVTSDPKLAMENMKIDIGVIGEGEETVSELAKVLGSNGNIAEVKGIVYYDNIGNPVMTGERMPISNLDSLPMPDYEGLDFRILMNSTLPNSSPPYTIFDDVRSGKIIASRSCPFSCTFCYHPLGKKYRQRSLDNVFQEINYLVKEYDINGLIIMDELFSSDKKRMYEFAKRIKPYNLKWMTQLRVSDVDKPVLRALKDSGLYLISYGIESLSDDILKSMKKGTSKVQIEKALRLTHEEKIGIQGYIIFGDPNETAYTSEESLNWWNNHKEYSINLGLLKAVPDSRVYRQALESGKIKNKLDHIRNNFPVINLTKMSDRKFQRICDFVNFFCFNKKYFMIGDVISSKRQPEINGKKLYTVIVRCPICKEAFEYKNMHQVMGKFTLYQEVFCKHCYTRMRLDVRRSFHKNHFVTRFILTIIDSMSRFRFTNNILFYANKYRGSNH